MASGLDTARSAEQSQVRASLICISKSPTNKPLPAAKVCEASQIAVQSSRLVSAVRHCSAAVHSQPFPPQPLMLEASSNSLSPHTKDFHKESHWKGHVIPPSPKPAPRPQPAVCPAVSAITASLDYPVTVTDSHVGREMFRCRLNPVTVT